MPNTTMPNTTMPNTSMSDATLAARRWALVQSRQSESGESFIYAVKTTGVYCLPGCASRLPRRENVLFFDSPSAAELAGFRACRRCRPNQRSMERPAAKAVRLACEQMAASEEPVRLAELASAAGYTPGYFHRLFKRFTGITPRAYAQILRTKRLQEDLPTADTITGTWHRVGHGSSSQFYRAASQTLGMTPSAYQQGAAGEAIEMASAETYLGALVLAATERGVCAIELGDDAERLKQKLRARFPHAESQPTSARAQTWLAKLLAHIEQPRTALELPLEIQGTAFQCQVWEALRRIPPGQAMTYSQLAQRLDKPKAVRAVASACAANKLAVAIPCHRAVRADGKPSGYRWGLERKAALLKREAE